MLISGVMIHVSRIAPKMPYRWRPLPVGNIYTLICGLTLACLNLTIRSTHLWHASKYPNTSFKLRTIPGQKAIWVFQPAVGTCLQSIGPIYHDRPWTTCCQQPDFVQNAQTWMDNQRQIWSHCLPRVTEWILPRQKLLARSVVPKKYVISILK